MKRAQIRWSDEDAEIMREWVKENKNVKISYKFSTPYLQSLFPTRTPNAIYDRWRDTRIKMGLSPVGDTEQPINCPKGFDLFSVINTAVNKFLSESMRHDERIIATEAENQELKALLQKLTKVREAVEGFKL